MTTSTLPRTQVLVRGSHAWRITKYNDYSFVARNNRGVTHTYDSEYKCNRFWDFLESVGFKLRTDAWSLKTLVVHEVSTPPITPAPAPSFYQACARNTPARVTDEECARIAAERADK